MAAASRAAGAALSLSLSLPRTATCAQLIAAAAAAAITTGKCAATVPLLVASSESDFSTARLCGTRSTSDIVASSERIQTRLRCTSSKLLCGVLVLLAVCSVSSLVSCIALTGFSLSFIKLSRQSVSTGSPERDVERNHNRHAPQAGVWTEQTLRPLLADRRPSERPSSKLSLRVERYSWDCAAQAGRAKCRLVQKAHNSRKGRLLNVHYQYRQPVAAVRVLVEGVYHVSTQVAGIVWQPPPTLLRVVISRAPAKSGANNVTTVHSITGAGGGNDALAVSQRGAFSVYTAVSWHLSAGEELLAQVVCLERPDCVVHVNGTTSHLTLERLV